MLDLEVPYRSNSADDRGNAVENNSIEITWEKNIKVGWLPTFQKLQNDANNLGIDLVANRDLAENR